MPESKQIDSQLADYRKAVDFISAAQLGDVDQVKQFLNAGVLPDTPDAMHKLEPEDPSFERRAKITYRCVGLSALSSAACLGHTDVCETLLDAGAQVDIQEPKEAMQTPLMLAIKNGQIQVMHLLLDRGADCLVSDVVGDTALKLTRYLKDASEATIALSRKLNEQRSRMTVVQSVIHRDTEQLKKLLADGHSANEFHTDGFSALFYACLLGNAEAASILLAAGGDANIGSNGNQETTSVLSFVGQKLERISAKEFFAKKASRTIYQDRLLFGEAPLFAACEVGHKDVVTLMLKAGCEVNASTKVGRVSPLMLAIISQNLELITFLIDSGADLNHKDSRGASVLEWASKAHHTPDNTSVRDLIRESLGMTNATQDFSAAFKKFKEVEATPEFQSAMEYMSVACQSKPYPWKKKKGVYRYYTNMKAWDSLGQTFGKGSDYLKSAKKQQKEERQTELADLLQDEIRKRGFLLVTHKDEEGKTMQLLFPTSDKYAVIAACGTDGMNYGHGNGEVIQLLTEMEETNPFVISECMHDAVGGRFLSSVAQPLKLAEALYAICPDLADGQIICDESDIANELETRRRFYLWWG